MSLDDGIKLTPPVLHELRRATAASHERLDAAFGSLDLRDRADFTRFLVGHAISVAPVTESLRAFVENELAMACPDYPALLRADLSMLGIDGQLPVLDIELDRSPDAVLGLAYVVAGSRLGLAMLRKRGYFGRSNGRLSLYMEDEAGIAIWRALLRYMERAEMNGAQIALACRTALAVFEIFAQGFAKSAACAHRFALDPQLNA